MTAAPTISLATRRTLYLALNGMLCVGVLIASLAGGAEDPRSVFLWLLIPLCTAPLLWMEQLNGRYTLLGIFFAAYFVFYGANDAVALLGSGPRTHSQGWLSVAEIAILAGAVFTIAGYRTALSVASRTERQAPRDWPMNLIVVVGLIFWCVGTLTDFYWQLNFTNMKSFEGRGNFLMVALVIARMLQPLGTIMLGCVLASTRSRPLLFLVLALLAVQAMVGFIGNSKETAMRGVIIITMATLLIQGRLPKAWLAGAAAFVVLAFPIFQAYRAEVIGVHGMTREAAAQDVGRSIELALNAREKVQKGASEDYQLPSFLERSGLKPTIEMIMEKTGRDVEYQHGYTLGLYFTGFVPRFLWPTKPDSSVGKLVNAQFRVSPDPDTYISATHLGELYWNFGWPGIVLGMFAFGFLIGYVNARCDLSQRQSLTRLLILITTIYATIVRFEGSIALEYTVYTRSLFVIALLHLMFARQPAGMRQSAPGTVPAPPRAQIHAPQLLR